MAKPKFSIVFNICMFIKHQSCDYIRTLNLSFAARSKMW